MLSTHLPLRLPIGVILRPIMIVGSCLLGETSATAQLAELTPSGQYRWYLIQSCCVQPWCDHRWDFTSELQIEVSGEGGCSTELSVVSSPGAFRLTGSRPELTTDVSWWEESAVHLSIAASIVLESPATLKIEFGATGPLAEVNLRFRVESPDGEISGELATLGAPFSQEIEAGLHSVFLGFQARHWLSDWTVPAQEVSITVSFETNGGVNVRRTSWGQLKSSQ